MDWSRKVPSSRDIGFEDVREVFCTIHYYYSHNREIQQIEKQLFLRGTEHVKATINLIFILFVDEMDSNEMKTTSVEMSEPSSEKAPVAPDNQLLLVDEQKMVDIEKPHHNDVLCGRGVTTNRHPGNESFRSLVGLNKVRILFS